MMDDLANLYDDILAIEHIRGFLKKSQVSPKEQDCLTDDDLTYLIDLIFDYYESRGIFNDDTDTNEVIDIDSQEMLSYMQTSIKKDQIGPFSTELLEAVIEAEAEYADSIEE